MNKISKLTINNKIFIKRFFYKIKIFFRSIVFFKYNHKMKIIPGNNSSIIFNNIPFINIENEERWKFNNQNSELVSSLLMKNYTDEMDYPLIESWLKIKNKTYAPNNFFINEQYKNIYPNLIKNKIFYNKAIYVLPYYTTVFGHFAGDVLGSILYSLKFF